MYNIIISAQTPFFLLSDAGPSPHYPIPVLFNFVEQCLPHPPSISNPTQPHPHSPISDPT